MLAQYQLWTCVCLSVKTQYCIKTTQQIELVLAQRLLLAYSVITEFAQLQK